MNAILTGQVFYSYQHELLKRDSFADLRAHFSGIAPFHKHEGEIALSDEKIFISGDENLQIPLTSIDQIYLGFDEAFPRTLVKNMGLFWQPLRLSLSNGNILYLIVDYNVLGANNQLWFNELKELLSA
ncbi:hypothetical protein [Daejeonella sp.]|uniref:hypothetical protein n=1 Tax=Daejeonella sp. TaxID=2805397 RepID=UPI003983BEFE